MIACRAWETIPFHVIWISLTILYGFRVWSIRRPRPCSAASSIATGASIMTDAFDGLQLWGELFEVPLMSAMFLAMVWHARRRAEALETVEALAEERAALLEQEERLLHDVSHELRTPVTIARGHLELLGRRLGDDEPELTVAFDELQRIEQIVDRLLLLARAERPDCHPARRVRLVPFLEDVFMRWAEVAPRAWRLGEIVDVTLQVDETWLAGRARRVARERRAVHPDDTRDRALGTRRGSHRRDRVSDEARGSPAELADARLRAVRPLRRLSVAAGRRRRTRPRRSWRRSPAPTGAVLGPQRRRAKAPRSSCGCRSGTRHWRISRQQPDRATAAACPEARLGSA